MKNIAIFVSGKGSNAARLMEVFQHDPEVRVKALLSNNPRSEVLEKARSLQIPVFVFNKAQLFETGEVLKYLRENNIHLVVLAGFLWQVPNTLISEFPDRIINIHPSLLPKFGGKGMYGHHVHKAVIDHREKQSGITIHYVNNEYDKGKVIFSKSIELAADETPETLAQRIRALEHVHFPEEVKKVLAKIER